MRSWSPVLAEPEHGATPMTLEEWIALPEDAPGELVDGHLTEEEVPDPIHELAVSWLIALFQAWLGPGRGFVFASNAKFVVGPKGGRKPDVSVYLPQRSAPPRRRALHIPPDFIVEVVSASPSDERRDRVTKMEDYARFGVSFYWLLDPALGSLEIFELADGRYARGFAATHGTLTRIPGCDGLTVGLDDLWANLRRLSDQP